MICFPNAKINLGLSITGLRDDGFHTIETCYYPIPMSDILEFVPADEFELTLYGLPIEGDPKQNLVSKVWALMHGKYGIPPVKVALFKRIPIQAGLGGGSSDAAFFMRQLNTFFDLGLSVSEMEELILPLGSDCPFFIQNSPAIGRGKGDLLTSVSLSLKGFCGSLFVPEAKIATSLAYAHVVPKRRSKPLRELLELEPKDWRLNLFNDFQPVAEFLHPEIKLVTENLYVRGAFYASLSGSGSAVFALSNTPLALQGFPMSGFCYQWVF